MLDRENSPHFAKPTLVSLRKETNARNSILMTIQVCVALLIGWSPRSTTNQRHYPDLSSDGSSVWNFGASFTDVISRGNQCRLSRNVGCFLTLSKCVQNTFEENSHSEYASNFLQPITSHKLS